MTKEYIYKVLVVGNSTVGKTSIIKRYVHDIFSQTYKSTIGVDFALKRLEWDSDTVIQIQLWDIAGQERFGNMTRVYYKQAVGAIVVYDLTNPNTLEDVKTWKNDIDQKVLLPDDTPIPCLLLGNKSDLVQDEKINQEEMAKFAKEHGFIGNYETSALTGHNIEKSIAALIKKILEKNFDSEDYDKPKETITLEDPKKVNPNSNDPNTKGGCSSC